MVRSPNNLSAYKDFFRQSIPRTACNCLQQVRSAETIPPTSVRQQAMHILTFLAKEQSAWSVTRELLLTIAPMMEQAGHRDDWLPLLTQGIRHSQQQEDAPAEAELTMQLALLYQLRSQTELAFETFSRAETLFREISEPQNQARALNRMAYMACLLQQPVRAKSLVTMAMRLLTPRHEEFALSYQVLGELALARGDWQCGEDHFRQALKLGQPSGNKRQMARRLRDLGNALFFQGDYPTAAECYVQAIDLFGEVQDSVQQAVVYINLGALLLLTEEVDRALHQFSLAEPVLHQVQDLRHLAMLYTNRGIGYHKQQKWKKAEQAFRVGIEYQQRAGSAVHIIDSLIDFGQLQIDRCLWKSAKEILLEATQLLSQIVDTTKQQQYRTKIDALISDLHGESISAEIPSPNY